MANIQKVKAQLVNLLPSPKFWLKRWWGKPVVVFVFALGFVLIWAQMNPAQAVIDTLATYMLRIMNAGLEVIANLISGILLWLFHFIIQLSGYNNFLNARVVQIGWSLTRDMANMFYIVVLLLIAFGTMLKIERFDWRKSLPRLLFTALLVNFSKTIIGVLIDFGQVVMLTFVNGYAATAGGNFVTMFGIDQLFKLQTTGEPPAGQQIPYSITMGYILGVVILGISVIVIAVFAAILLFRIIMLWILIVLAPLAFLAGAVPVGKFAGYYSRWWEQLINNIVVGPVVAFFLWLSLATMGSGNNITEITTNNAIPDSILNAQGEAGVSGMKLPGSSTEYSTWENLGSFAVAIAMLFAGLQMIQELGVAGASLAGSASGMMKSAATSAARKLALPVGLAVATGGIAPGLAALGGLKLAQAGGKFGLKQAKSGVSKVGEAGLGVMGNVPIIGGAATRKKAEMRAERFAEARKGAENVRDFTPEEVIRESQRTALTDEGKQMKFAAQTRVLGDKKLRTQMQSTPAGKVEFDKMVAGYKQFGDDMGQSDKANSTLKELLKENPQLHAATPATLSSPAKTREENIRDDMRGQGRSDKLKLSNDSLADQVVVRNLTREDQEEIFEKGSPKQKEALGKTALAQKLEQNGINSVDAQDYVQNPGAHGPALSAEISKPGFVDSLPKGFFNELKDIYATVKNTPAGGDIVTQGKIDPASLGVGDFAGTDGEDLAARVAKSNNEDLIKEVQLKVGPDFEAALARYAGKTTAPPAGSLLPVRNDPKVLNVLEALNRNTTGLLARILAARPADSRQMLRASNSVAWLKKVEPSELITAGGAPTAAGTQVGQNLSLAALGKIISEANKTGSAAMKEAAACLAALVQKSARTNTRVNDAGVATPMSGPEKKRLNGMLTGPGVGDIDWEAKYNKIP